MNALAKPGRYGTLYLYLLRYTDRHDDGCPIFESRVWRYGVEHARDAFYESNDGDDGWALLSVERVRAEGSQHGATRHAVETVRGLS